MIFKQLIVVLTLGFIMLGCASKTQSNINPYVTLNNNTNSKNLKINFKEVKDKRDVKVVSTIYNKKKIEKEFPVNVDIQAWYKEAFIRELKSIDMYTRNNDAKIDVMVNIKQLKATYDKYSISKENMKANVSIELVAKQDNTTYKINVNLDQSMYKPMILDAQGFETILNDIMITSVSKSIESIIAKFLK